MVTAGWQTERHLVVREPEAARRRVEEAFHHQTATTPRAAVMADINGDGVPDLVFAHYNHSGDYLD